jgi:hypothetical protein
MATIDAEKIREASGSWTLLHRFFGAGSEVFLERLLDPLLHLKHECVLPFEI